MNFTVLSYIKHVLTIKHSDDTFRNKSRTRGERNILRLRINELSINH